MEPFSATGFTAPARIRVFVRGKGLVLCRHCRYTDVQHHGYRLLEAVPLVVLSRTRHQPHSSDPTVL